MARFPVVLLAAMSFPMGAWAADTACGTPHSTRDAIADGDLRRSLQCESFSPDARAMQLCCALEQDLTWSWWGHATVSPGWRIDWDGVRDVYCRQNVRATDIDTLTRLSHGNRSQLQSGAEFLLRLVLGDDDGASIFNRKTRNTSCEAAVANVPNRRAETRLHFFICGIGRFP